METSEDTNWFCENPFMCKYIVIKNKKSTLEGEIYYLIIYDTFIYYFINVNLIYYIIMSVSYTHLDVYKRQT